MGKVVFIALRAGRDKEALNVFKNICFMAERIKCPFIILIFKVRPSEVVCITRWRLTLHNRP